MADIYISSTVGNTGYAAVFEADDDTSYFYLLNEHAEPKIKLAVPVHFGKLEFSAQEVSVFWGPGDQSIVLAIQERPVAAFDVKVEKAYGGLHGPALPQELRSARPR